MRYALLPCLFLLTAYTRAAQNDNVHQVVAKVSVQVPVEFFKLRLNNDSISDNDKLNEEIVDLVNVSERDTMVPTHFTTHQGGGFGWFIRMIGFWWQAIDRHRYKFVGTSKNLPSLPEHDELTEHDINFDMLPHLKKYQDLMWYGISSQLKRRKARHHDPTKPPYIYPTDSTLYLYRVHCELTPPKHYRHELSVKFSPCLPGPNFDTHPNICDAHPTLGMYGPYVLDCNHSCHPEIHPYEWLWWLDLNVRGGVNPDPKDWLVGFFKESSDRFELWTLPPRVGLISIPFLFKTTETKSYMKVTHLVTGHFSKLGLKRVKKRVPKQTGDFNFTDTEVNIQLGDDKFFTMGLHTNKAMTTSCLRWWLSDVETDPKHEWVWGYFNMMASVRNVYTARVEYVPMR